MPGSNSGSTTNPDVHVMPVPAVTVHIPGQHPLPASASVPATAIKGSAGQTISVHGTTAGVVFDNQVTK